MNVCDQVMRRGGCWGVGHAVGSRLGHVKEYNVMIFGTLSLLQMASEASPEHATGILSC